MGEVPHNALLLDVSRLIWRAREGGLPTGIDRTCLAYVGHYRDRSCAVVQRGRLTQVLPHDFSQKLFDILLSSELGHARQQLTSLAWHGVGRALVGRIRQQDIAGRIYLNVGHTGLDKLGHEAWIRQSGVKPVYFVHDLIPITHPEYCRPKEPEKHFLRITALLRNGVGIIGNSRDTLDEAALFAGRQQSLQMPPAVVAPLGADCVLPPPSLEGVHSVVPPRPYFVMVGTIEGRKNHLLILTLWAELARRLGKACPQLVVIGQRGWESEQAVDMLERCVAIRGHFIELSRCDDITLGVYMRGARALLFPSFVEGYGLPLIEALASGTPVIASDLGVFRELAGEIPDYLSPIDGLGWSRLIEEFAQPDSVRRDAQLKRLAGWQPPSWEEHFAKVDRWLEQFNSQP
ncbi:MULTISPECIES: glycosyltransferase family 4 protein [Sphingobium]|uniref:glycosyltransferase family 4 protein n=1 Tax=Sphingobium TaxID=165695 RepID=UPI0015EBF3E7|nr:MULTISPECIES: glycosyltransferase family 1 protein [Sphingobium]MCW2361392.1 glycosyltransferase involved in cell wall biosynthesis [Sphingobium sp. B10D3B]MCW2401929.1 glycosyltransferase involved in cell wall biosynthesis [Sphingobium sp. B10D7B]MCW2408908.1 glycosyltransferase involved in cell wall biosynthesis [Sphingobium xanthum]